VILDGGRKRAGRKIAVGADPARPVHDGDPVAGLLPEPADDILPGERIGREGGAHQPRFVLQPLGDVALEVASQCTLGDDDERPDRDDEDEEYAENQPAGKAHRRGSSAARNR
jgi:hypothetical protein